MIIFIITFFIGFISFCLGLNFGYNAGKEENNI